jgi:SAM-dependent methyltransferase
MRALPASASISPAYDRGLRAATSVTHLHILAVIQTELELARGERRVKILDAGCGEGALMGYLQANLAELNPGVAFEVHGFDVHDSLTEHAPSAEVVTANLVELFPDESWEERVRYVSVADQWPYPNDDFDVVVSNTVIEHVADLDFFLGELARTMKPGSFSVHVFPLRRVLYEWHLKMPLVHLIEDFRLRERMIEVLSRSGIGLYPDARATDGIDVTAYGRTRADFIQFGTFYRSWREVARAAKRARLRATHRYTRGLYLQKLRTLLSLDEAHRYAKRTAPLADLISFAVLPQLANATIVLEKPPVPDTWRRAPARAEP